MTIATGYLAELIEAFFRDGASYGVGIDYHREHEPLGTVGALALIDGLDQDDVLVMNGDVLTDIDYGALLERHRASDAAATIATKVRHIQVSLGVLRFRDEADPTRLTGYDEKPAIDFTASMGVYCFAPRALSFIKPGERLDFPDLVLRLIAAGEVVRAWPSDDYWLAMGATRHAARPVARWRTSASPGPSSRSARAASTRKCWPDGSGRTARTPRAQPRPRFPRRPLPSSRSAAARSGDRRPQALAADPRAAPLRGTR